MNEVQVNMPEIEESKKITAKGVNYVYFISTLLMIVISFIISVVIFSYTYLTKQGDEKNILFFYGSPFIEFISLFFPIMFYFIITKTDYKKVLRLNKLSIINVFALIIIGVAAQFAAGFLNNLMLFLLQLLGKVPAQNIPSPTTIQQFILALIIVALIPAFLEESLFRGLILRAYEGLGWKAAVVFSAALFSMSHFSLINLLSMLFLGLLFGYLVYRTNSLFAGILLHFINNATAEVILYRSPVSTSKFYDKLTGMNMLTSLGIGVGAVLIIVGLLYLINKTLTQTDNQENTVELVETDSLTKSNLYHWPIILTIGILIYFFINTIIDIISNS